MCTEVRFDHSPTLFVNVEGLVPHLQLLASTHHPPSLYAASNLTFRSIKMATKTLFHLPILSSPKATSASGTVIVTSPADAVYILTFTSPPDNRLVTSFCQTLLLALDILEHDYPPGVLITTSGIPKFYSNGLDLEHASSTKGFYHNSLFALFRRFLTYVVYPSLIFSNNVSNSLVNSAIQCQLSH